MPLLKNNCKYEFRNFPYEFHNGGSWPMVNGFVGLAMLSNNQTDNAAHLLEKINLANAVDDFSFYENFNTQTEAPNGVAFCAWSAAATVLLHQSLHSNFKLLQWVNLHQQKYTMGFQLYFVNGKQKQLTVDLYMVMEYLLKYGLKEN